jgi:hypothetical protein
MRSASDPPIVKWSNEMSVRRLIGCLCVIVLTAASGGASAQVNYSGEGGCNKSLFWPFVRSPGDCLTDAERAQGMRGTYRGDEAAEAEPAAAEQPALQTGGAANAQNAPEAVQPTAPPAASSTAVQGPAPISQSAAPPSPAMPPAPAPQPVENEVEAEVVPAADGRAEYLGEGGCSKGIFWPFVRRTGDCLTDAELRSGRSGTYQE